MAKKWPRTRRALERYYANISLMCDNCRLYNEGFKVRLARSQGRQLLSACRDIVPAHSSAPTPCPASFTFWLSTWLLHSDVLRTADGRPCSAAGI